MRTIPLILAVLASGPVLAQDAADDITRQIAVYQAGMAAGCKDAGHRQGAPAEQVDAFCGCLVQVLKTELTQAEWQQAYQYSLNHQSKEEMQVLGPHLQKAQSCRGNVL